MDLAFIFTFLVFRCLSSEVEMCALSISIRQDALGTLGLPVAAFARAENNKSGIVSIAEVNTIVYLNSFRFIASENGKSRSSPRKLSTRSRKLPGVIGPEFWDDMRNVNVRATNAAQDSGLTDMAEDEGFEPSVGCPTHAFQACALGRYANPPG